MAAMNPQAPNRSDSGALSTITKWWRTLFHKPERPFVTIDSEGMVQLKPYVDFRAVNEPAKKAAKR